MQLSYAEVGKVKTRVVPKLLRKRQRTKKHRGSYTRTHMHKTPTFDNPTTQHSLSSQNTTIHSTLRNFTKFTCKIKLIFISFLSSYTHLYFYSFFIFQHLQTMCSSLSHINPTLSLSLWFITLSWFLLFIINHAHLLLSP